MSRSFLGDEKAEKGTSRQVTRTLTSTDPALIEDTNAEVLFKQHNISSTQAAAMSEWLLDVDARVIDAIKLAKQRGFVSTGDAVIVVTGWVKHVCHSYIVTSLPFFSRLASGPWYYQHPPYYLCGLDSQRAHERMNKHFLCRQVNPLSLF